MGVTSSFPPGFELVPAFRHWMHGYMLQTLFYGANAIIFFLSIWVLSIHIMKGLHIRADRFHKHHLLQNALLLLYSIVMFGLSTVLMAHQTVMAGDAWFKFLDNVDTSARIIVEGVFGDRAGLQKACSTTLVLINWGTIGMLLWRCVVHWKIRSVFPSEIMVLPFLVFAACIATGLLQVVRTVGLDAVAPSTRQKNWTLIAWALSTGEHYLLAIMIATRILYHRTTIQKELNAKDVNKFAGYLTISYDSGFIVLPFATAYLIALAKFPNLIFLFQAAVAQNQVMLSLLIVQRLSAGRAWSGKTIDCILNASRKATEHSIKQAQVEDITTMGFNPNTEVSSTQNDDDSERSKKRGNHDLVTDIKKFQGAVNKV
ncbi:hypothetical protein NP233_g9009 [Leucocoprinus birnbaumii]|uniref:Uncharacterized protein n=1 Tax=Leucocoprinus birnbaumii TaxID=56174 RepID=A0AAD5YTB1_9AGAR|nr:hypothetical protein NP233_g9009 [Leucocoprinus birnbaumii]